MNQRAKALRDFQNDPPTTIFLLSMRYVRTFTFFFLVFLSLCFIKTISTLDLILHAFTSYPTNASIVPSCHCYRAGAVGINLTQANRIFLMEPSFNPALEAQAIGRCHRLGQKRAVETIRLIVEHSFEERMTNFIEKKYGLSSKKGENEEDSNEEDEDEKKSIAVDDSKVRDLAGNLQTDKCTLVLEEFDALFGVENRVLSIENPSVAIKPKAGGVKADKITSGII